MPETISNTRRVEPIAFREGCTLSGMLYSDAISSKDGPAPSCADTMHQNTRTIIEAFAAVD